MWRYEWVVGWKQLSAVKWNKQYPTHHYEFVHRLERYLWVVYLSTPSPKAWNFPMHRKQEISSSKLQSAPLHDSNIFIIAYRNSRFEDRWNQKYVATTSSLSWAAFRRLRSFRFFTNIWNGVPLQWSGLLLTCTLFFFLQSLQNWLCNTHKYLTNQTEF